MKQCLKCGQYKEAEGNFFRRKANKDGYRTTCKGCGITQAVNRRSILRVKFGISAEKYDSMLEKQNGLCAICKNITEQHLAVDHCHTTGKVRGLLCLNCNTGLGQFKESPDLLRAALQYLLEGSL